MKIKVVYDKPTKRLLPVIWNKDGTVTIKKSVKYTEAIVTMIDPKFVDFDNGIVYIEEE